MNNAHRVYTKNYNSSLKVLKNIKYNLVSL